MDDIPHDVPKRFRFWPLSFKYIYIQGPPVVCVCVCFSPKFELVPLINETKRNEMDIDLSELNVLF